MSFSCVSRLTSPSIAPTESAPASASIAKSSHEGRSNHGVIPAAFAFVPRVTYSFWFVAACVSVTGFCADATTLTSFMHFGSGAQSSTTTSLA